MVRSFITNVIMVVIAAAFAWFFVNAFDAWYKDKEERRARKRDRREYERNNFYE